MNTVSATLAQSDVASTTIEYYLDDSLCDKIASVSHSAQQTNSF